MSAWVHRSRMTRTRCGTPVFSLVAVALVSFLLLGACGPPTGADRASAEAEIYASVTRYLLEFNNTFGAHHRFAEVLVVNHLDPDAGDALKPWDRSTALLSDDQRTAITAAIEDLAPVRFIDSQWDYIRKDELAPVIRGSAIITLAPVDFDSDGATVGANLWCGGLCGLWLTYRVTDGPDGWTVTGTEGTRSIS